jgi:hypothetical protein
MLPIIIVLVVIIILLWKQNENFDTYWNHSMGAQSIYAESKDPIQQHASKHMKESETLAGYTWSRRQPNGMQLYDHYYDKLLLENQMDGNDPSYNARDLESSYLDSKFQTLNTVKGYDSAGGNFNHYDAVGMLDPNPLYTVYNGEYITLSQKRF